MSHSVLKRLDQLLLVVACSLLVLLLFTVTAGIVSRAVGRPFVWTDEAGGYLMVWVSMFGWMIATRRSAHIRIRFFNDMLPVNGRRALEVVFLLTAAGLGVLVAFQGVHLALANADVETITLRISTAWLYAPLVPAGIVMASHALADIIALREKPAPAAEGLLP